MLFFFGDVLAKRYLNYHVTSDTGCQQFVDVFSPGLYNSITITIVTNFSLDNKVD